MRLLLILIVLLTVIAIANSAGAAKRRGKGKGRNRNQDIGRDDAGEAQTKGKGKRGGKFAGMTKEERRSFMREWKAGKQSERRNRQKERLARWRATEKAKGKRRKEGDENLPKNFYSALVDGKPKVFRGYSSDDEPDVKNEPEEIQEAPETTYKAGKLGKLEGKSMGPKADGVKAEDFELVSRKGRRKTLKKWGKENKKKWEARLGKRGGKGRRWKERENQRGGKGKGGAGKGKGRNKKGQDDVRRVKRAETYAKSDNLWPSPHIKYMFGSTFYSTYRRNMRQAMDMWEAKSCLKFTEIQTIPSRYDDEPYYIFIDSIDLNQCWADRLGINKFYDSRTGYRTTINAGWCRTEIGSLAHELGHVLGLAHSQKRTDRDDHIKVYMTKIDADWRGQYEKNKGYTYDDYGIPYYYESLMHYPPTFNGDTVICALDPLTELEMGQREKIQFKDYSFINKLYCEEECIDQYEMANTAFDGSYLSQTISGRVCQKWTADYPHSHGYESVGDHNFCRNPDKWEAGPWCYTTDINMRYEPCISSCQKLEREQVPSCEGYCHNGGFFDEMCECTCPDYASGDHCEIVNLRQKYSNLQCGGKIELDAEGSVESIQSMNYPYQYPASHKCRWWIQAPVGMFVAMEVDDFDLEGSNGGSCMYDYVRIDLSNCPESPPRPDDIKFCGKALLADEKYYEASKTRDLVITFESDSSVQHNGFKLNFYAFK